MNPLFGILIVVLIVFIAIALVLSFSTPLVESAQETITFKDAESAMKHLDSLVLEMAKEGTGSTRTARLDFRGNMLVIPEEDAVQYEFAQTFPFIDSFSRILEGNLIIISGNDVSCSAQNNLVMENNYLRAEFQNIPMASPHSSINTQNNIKLLKEKSFNNTEIVPSNSSIIIDRDYTTGSGTGYSQILKEGSNLPACTVHFFVNSTNADYDAFYTLYAGADFLVMEVRNVR